LRNYFKKEDLLLRQEPLKTNHTESIQLKKTRVDGFLFNQNLTFIFIKHILPYNLVALNYFTILFEKCRGEIMFVVLNFAALFFC